MEDLVISMGKLFMGFLGLLCPLYLRAAFLRSRERREAELATKVLQELNSKDLRGLFSVKVKGRLIGADTVVVDLWNCSREQVWDLMERLSARLPDQVRIEVNRAGTRRLNPGWTLTFRNDPAVAECGCG